LKGDYDVCVIGAGPAGLACAFDLHDRGFRVLVLEAGRENPIPGEPDIHAAEIVHAAFHDPVDIVAASALGGSTHWWGGRSLPFDPVDFRHWPLAYDEMAPWWEKAAEFLGTRAVSESAPPAAFARLKDFNALHDETWAQELNMAHRWRARIHAAIGPYIVLGARVTGLDHDAGSIRAVRVRTGARTQTVSAPRIVIASGGLGALKHLLLLQREAPALFGSAPLGRGYMGHLTGTIATLLPADVHDVAAFARRALDEGVYARRRLRAMPETIMHHGISNIAFWLEHRNAIDPAHGSAAASARHLAARFVRLGRGIGPVRPHIANIARAPLTAASGLTRALYRLAAARLSNRPAAALTPVRPGEWRLDYHAEQPRHHSNRISLAEALDSVGSPKLKIDFRIHDEEVEAVVRAHELLDADLQAAGAGRLRFYGGREACVVRVRAAARDGYHQLGGAVMGDDPHISIVDANLRVHGLSNLWVASGSVFPSSGQANPTLTIVALARRLAAHIAGKVAL
jgi:glycine/D-amino acid oxidase-like deaminating enzyme